MVGCCGGASCACKIVDGLHTTVEGVGSAVDPFVINLDFALTVVDSDVFELTLAGAGTAAAPYALSVAFAASATFSDLPEVSDTPPSNSQVLGWNDSLGVWQPQNPTTAASGSVSHDTSLTGDGSGGSPLAVRHATGRFTATNTGIGLTDDGVRSLVRRFANAAARTAASIAPVLNSLSALDTAPGAIDYWNGTGWVPLHLPTVVGGELLELSGSYAGTRTTRLIKQIAVVTDVNGQFDVLTGADYGSAAGILTAQLQPVGAPAYACSLDVSGASLRGTAYRLDSGAVYASQPIQATVSAEIY